MPTEINKITKLKLVHYLICAEAHHPFLIWRDVLVVLYSCFMTYKGGSRVCNGGFQAKVVYHLQEFSGKSGSKVNGTRLFGSSQRKISGSNGTSEKVVLFFRTKYSKRKFVFHFLKAIFDTSLRPSRPFSVKWNWSVQMVNAIPELNLPVLNFAYHLPKP